MTPKRGPDGGRFTEEARQADPDRFLCLVNAPAADRDRLCVLLLFNHELARAVELPPARSGAGPIASLIRLQWWRDVIENSRDDWRTQPLASALRGLIDEGRVEATLLDEMIGAREDEAQGPLALDLWRETLLRGPGGLQRAIGSVLSGAGAANDRVAAVGAAYACGALRRYLPVLTGRERTFLPEEMIDAPIASQRGFLAAEGASFIARTVGPRQPLAEAGAAATLVLAKRDLTGRPDGFDRTGGARGLSDRLAVIAAGWRAANRI